MILPNCTRPRKCWSESGTCPRTGSGRMFWMYVSTSGERSLTVFTTSFSRPMALSIRAFWPAVSLREGRTSSLGFFLPMSGIAAEAGSAVAMMAASRRPAADCFRKIMILNSYDGIMGHLVDTGVNLAILTLHVCDSYGLILVQFD